MNYDDLNSKPEKFMAGIFKFLNVKYFDVPTSKRYNTADDNLKKGGRVVIDQDDVDRLRILFRPEIKRIQEKVDFDVSHWLGSN